MRRIDDARIKLNELRKQGVVQSDSVRDFPGEVPNSLAVPRTRAVTQVTDLADDLAWTDDHVLGLLGNSRDKPKLSLVLTEDG